MNFVTNEFTLLSYEQLVELYSYEIESKTKGRSR